jgi:hypothetical protein
VAADHEPLEDGAAIGKSLGLLHAANLRDLDRAGEKQTSSELKTMGGPPPACRAAGLAGALRAMGSTPALVA